MSDVCRAYKMPRKKRKLQRPKPPSNVERYYVSKLRSIWLRIEKVTWQGIDKLLAVWPSEYRNDATDEESKRMLARLADLAKTIGPPPRYPEYRVRPYTGATDYPPRIVPVNPLLTRVLPPPNITRVDNRTVRQILDWINEATSQVIHIEDVIPIFDSVLRRTSNHVTNDLRRILRIPIADIIDLSLVNVFRNTNIDLIESGIWADRAVPSLRKRALLPQVSEVVQNAHTQGLRVEVLREQLKQRFDVGHSRADLIARDQVLKVNGQINRSRQKQVGIMEYEWSTARDARVRKKPKNHRVLDGRKYSWDSPPSSLDLHPGQDYQCRCVGIPVAPDWLDA